MVRKARMTVIVSDVVAPVPLALRRRSMVCHTRDTRGPHLALTERTAQTAGLVAVERIPDRGLLDPGQSVTSICCDESPSRWSYVPATTSRRNNT
jgi:hypothetical protein